MKALGSCWIKTTWNAKLLTSEAQSRKKGVESYEVPSIDPQVP